MLIDKTLVRSRFVRAQASYDRQAIIQHRVAQRLLALLPPANPAPRSILEIGCCTGLLSQRLLDRFPDLALFHANDLAPDFAPHLAEKIGGKSLAFSFLAGDIEQLALPRNYDLIISSSTFHWLHDLPGTLERLTSHLQNNGVLAFAMYGPANLQEIRELTGCGLDYYSLEGVRAMLAQFATVLAAEGEELVLRFDSPNQVLLHLRETGVNGIRTKPWSRKRLERFYAEYAERYPMDGGVRLTYHPLFFVATAKGQGGGQP